MSLRYKILFLFTLAIVLPALLLSAVLTSISRRTIRDLIFYQQYEILNRAVDKINQQIEKHQQLLKENNTITSLSPGSQFGTAKNLFDKSKLFYEISLMDPRGKELWKLNRSGKVNELLKKAGRTEFTEAKKGRSYISRITFSDRKNPFMIFSVPCSKPGYVLSAKLDLGQIWQLISEIKIGESGHAFIVDKKGNLIAHRDPERVLAHSDFSSLPIVKDFQESKAVTPDQWKVYRSESGEKVVSLYQPLTRLGWAVITQVPYREVYSPISSMYKNVFVWTSVWVVLFWVVGYRFVNKIIVPIEQLRLGASKISEGRLDVSFNINTGDEIQELAGDFEKMALSLKQLEELREDLIRMIVHDLKGPLSGIMGGLEYLESGMVGTVSDEQKKIISISRKSSENLLVMIQNLLDVAKMEEGKLELKREKVDLVKLLTERQSQFDALAKKEEKTLIFEPKVAAIEAEVDKNLVERVVNNLISNALHHTTTNGLIKIGLSLTGDAVDISVSDNGMGIPEEYKEKIFEKFVQVQRKQAHLRTGAGLGLTFCKMAVESHGGTIKVESELNKGSSFILTLPLKPGDKLREKS